MNLITKYACFFALSVLGLWQAVPALADEGFILWLVPGSAILFPFFVNAPPVFVDNVLLPRTEINITALCPDGVTCTDDQAVKVRFHWVCPGSQAIASKFVCPEVDFDIVLSVNGTLAFTADGTPINSNTPRVPKPPCKNGYLIGWVINPDNDLPVKFDGLMGDATIRGPALNFGPNAGTSTAVATYFPITIQAENPGKVGAEYMETG